MTVSTQTRPEGGARPGTRTWSHRGRALVGKRCGGVMAGSTGPGVPTHAVTLQDPVSRGLSFLFWKMTLVIGQL